MIQHGKKVIASDLPEIQEILTYGSSKILKISANNNNIFWKDVLETYAAFSSAFQPETKQILTEGVWFSDYTKFKCSVINKWNRKGIRFLADLINENSGKLHTKESLQETYGVKMTFLCFHSLIKSLPNELKTTGVFKEFGPIIPFRMNLVANHSNFSRLAYNVCVESRLSDIDQANAIQKEKWVRDVGCFEDGSFVKIIQATKSSRSRMFQYKLVNRFLATNRFLKIIKVKDDDRCTFCKQETETLAHMYWSCPKVQSFIADIKSGLIAEFSITLNINSKTWFFLTNLNLMETCVITLAKMVIYEARLKETNPSYNHLMNKLKLHIDTEFQAARQANKQEKFNKKWGPLRGAHTNQRTYV